MRFQVFCDLVLDAIGGHPECESCNIACIVDARMFTPFKFQFRILHCVGEILRICHVTHFVRLLDVDPLVEIGRLIQTLPYTLSLQAHAEIPIGPRGERAIASQIRRIGLWQYQPVLFNHFVQPNVEQTQTGANRYARLFNRCLRNAGQTCAKFAELWFFGGHHILMKLR